MKIVVIDKETTSVDIKNTFITEIGFLVLDPYKKRISKMCSYLVKPEDKFEISKEVEDLTGIDFEMLQDYGKPFSQIIDEIYDTCLPPFDEHTSFLCGHNIKNFDKPILDRYIDFYSKDKFMPQEYVALKNIPLIDTSVDLPIPKTINTRKLTHLAFEHGIIMQPAHRALVDCIMTANLLFKYDIDEVIALSQEEKFDVVAKIDGPWVEGFQDRKKAVVESGFRWNPDRKSWFKTMRKSEIGKEYPFKIEVLS